MEIENSMIDYTDIEDRFRTDYVFNDTCNESCYVSLENERKYCTWRSNARRITYVS